MECAYHVAASCQHLGDKDSSVNLDVRNFRTRPICQLKARTFESKRGADLKNAEYVTRPILGAEMSSTNRVAVFIDGANLHATAKTLGFEIDYRRLLKEMQSLGTLVRAFYYTMIIEDQEYSAIRPLVDWLDYNGYTVVTKPTKEFVDHSGRRRVTGNMDIELAVNAMELAAHIDQMVLFSGDGDFRSLVEAVQRRGVRVTVVSTIATQPALAADELRRQADVFTDLLELKPKIARDQSERKLRAGIAAAT